MKSVLSWIMIWLALLTPLTARAEPPLVLLSDSSSSYTAMFDALKASYHGELEATARLSGHPVTDRLIVGVGSRACDRALREAAPKTSLLCIFLPSQTFEDLSNTEKGRTMQKQKRLSALFLDQPLERQMRLARLLLPTIGSIGTVVGPDGERQAEQFGNAARAQGLEPIIGRLDNDDNPVKVLTPVIERSDLFLPLPDRSVFNRAAAKWILYISLRNRKPLIGFSNKYSDAGAVVALHSDIGEIALEAAERISSYQREKQLKPPSYPQRFSISVNRTAAHTLGLPPPDAETLAQQLGKTEGHD